MKFFLDALGLASVAAAAAAVQHGTGPRKPIHLESCSGICLPQRAYIDDFIAGQSVVALEQILCNIGPNGCHSQEVGSGLSIASPSRENPDYFYSWTRDSALVIKYIIEKFADRYDAQLQAYIQNYTSAMARIQGVDNLSGTLANGRGLGEPKFHVNFTSFNENWGRPQEDGPALRAISMATYATWLVENGYSDTASTILWPIIKNDLDYVAQFWNETNFDLWEEVKGSSFFTIAQQYRALVQGRQLATALGKPAGSYAAIAPHILCFLQSFWLPDKGYINANINTESSYGRSGIDSQTILASIHMFDDYLGCDNITFQPCSDAALSNHKVVIDSFRPYPINKGVPRGRGIAIGRYIEDVYQGGNPWFLNTLAAAEQLYDAVYIWDQEAGITVTDTSLPFFQDLIPDIKKGTHCRGGTPYVQLKYAVMRYADEFLAVVANYTTTNGSMSEQYSKDDGHQLSARDLTWSYAAFLSAVARRARILPPYWADEGVGVLPQSCLATSATGTYSTATATSFPPSQTPTCYTPPPSTTSKTSSATTSKTSSATTSSTSSCATPSVVSVTFEATVNTDWGESVFIVGSDTALGSWDSSKAVPLSPDSWPVWRTTVQLAAGQDIEYKYIRRQSSGNLVWEDIPNRKYTVPLSCSPTATVRDTWNKVTISTTSSIPSSTSSSTSSATCQLATSVAVSFELRASVNSGEEIRVIGSDSALGSWRPDDAPVLRYKSDSLWTATVNSKAGQKIEYKYIKRDQNGNVVWEQISNRVFTVPVSCAATLTRRDEWDVTPSTTTSTRTTTSSTSTGCVTATEVAVTFEVIAQTEPGEVVHVIGNYEALGGWQPEKAPALRNVRGNLWHGIVVLAAGRSVEYKYLKMDQEGRSSWEYISNRVFTVPVSCATSLLRRDSWDVVQTATTTSSSTSTGCVTATAVAVTFEVNAETESGEEVRVIGNIAALGGWVAERAPRLRNVEGILWQGVVYLAAGQSVEYKYLKMNQEGRSSWEYISNRVFTVPVSCATSLLRQDNWDVVQTATTTLTSATQTTTSPCSTVDSVKVRFHVHMSTGPKEVGKIIGNRNELGNWDPARAAHLHAWEDPWWAVLQFPAGAFIEYKYIRANENGEVTYENGVNRVLTVPYSCATQIAQDDEWQN